MTNASFRAKGDLLYKPQLLRNRGNRLMTGIAAAFSIMAIIPLIAVILFVLIKGFAFLRPAMFFELPPVPGQEMGGGIGNAFMGTFIGKRKPHQSCWDCGQFLCWNLLLGLS